MHLIVKSEVDGAVARTNSVNPLDVDAYQFNGINRSTPFFSTPFRSAGTILYIECILSLGISIWII